MPWRLPSCSTHDTLMIIIGLLLGSYIQKLRPHNINEKCVTPYKFITMCPLCPVNVHLRKGNGTILNNHSRLTSYWDRQEPDRGSGRTIVISITLTELSTIPMEIHEEPCLFDSTVTNTILIQSIFRHYTNGLKTSTIGGRNGRVVGAERATMVLP